MRKGGIRFQAVLFRFYAWDFRFYIGDSQRPAGAGRVTRGRRSRDPRAQVV